LPYFVYILYSERLQGYYIGQTNDVEARLLRHNSGSENYTSKYTPWELIWFCEKISRAEALSLEKKLKNLSRIRLKAFIEKYSG
jgi:putative endonuclease